MKKINTIKKFTIPIFIIIMIFICIFILISISDLSNDTDTIKRYGITGSYNLKEITGYNTSLNYRINNDTINNTVGINIDVIYNNITAITANIFIDNKGNGKFKIPLFSSVVYTFNAGKILPKILNHLYVNKINPLPFLLTITGIGVDEYEYFKPTGTEKELTNEDIYNIREKIKNYGD